MYDAPRELIDASGVTPTEMPRHADRGLCCGAGGARMWMEEHIGKRVNHERVDEALATDASKIATGCPFCRVMITDGVGDRDRAADVEVLDVAQLLLGSLDRNTITLPERVPPPRPRQPPRLRLKQHRWPSSQPPRPLHWPHQRKLPRPLRKLSRSRAWASQVGRSDRAPRRQPPRPPRL